jgi:hypothetical protein
MKRCNAWFGAWFGALNFDRIIMKLSLKRFWIESKEKNKAL